MRDPKLKILLIDDDEDFLFLSKKRLVDLNSNLKIITLTDTGNILNNIKQINPDLIICDLKMPELSGVDVNRVLTKNNCKIPFVLCSSEKIEKLMEVIEENNINYFIEKITPIELTFDKINSLINKTFSVT